MKPEIPETLLLLEGARPSILATGRLPGKRGVKSIVEDAGGPALHAIRDIVPVIFGFPHDRFSESVLVSPVMRDDAEGILSAANDFSPDLVEFRHELSERLKALL